MEVLIEAAKISGPLGMAVIIIYFIVKDFLRSMRAQREEFTEVIRNHFHEHGKAIDRVVESNREMRESHKEMIAAITQLIRLLEKNNRKK